MSRLACCNVAPEMSEKFPFEFLHFRLLPRWLIHKMFWPQYPFSKLKWEREPSYETAADFLILCWFELFGASRDPRPQVLLSRLRGEDAVICPPSWCCPWTTVAQKLLTFVCLLFHITFNSRFQSFHTNRAGCLKGGFRLYIYLILLLLCVFRVNMVISMGFVFDHFFCFTLNIPTIL